MKKQLILLTAIFFCISVNLFPQAFLDHNTGQYKLSIYPSGLIGHDYDAQGNLINGSGIKFGTTNFDAAYVGGFLMGTPATNASGHIGSFLIRDIPNQTYSSGFTSDANFNQISPEVTFTDNLSPNPIGVTIKQRSYSNTNDPYVFISYFVQNNTTTAKNNLYIGVFMDWDVGEANYALNRGGYDVANKLTYQFENGGANDPNYYGIRAMTNYAGGTVTTAGSSSTIRAESFTFMTSTAATPITANGDYRTWMSSGPFNLAPGQSTLVGFAFVGGANLSALVTNSQSAQAKWDAFLPVELTSFNAVHVGSKVELTWSTATEINNRGFEIERKIVNGNIEENWTTIGFKSGFGTTTEAKNYSFTDDISTLEATAIYYRLKQVDYDGRFEYSQEVMVDNIMPQEYSLGQNYPNPFNPSTKINFSVVGEKFVSLKVYNNLGQEVATLIDGMLKGGKHEVEFNASNFTSGVYYYTLRVGENDFVQTNKMILMK